MSTASDVPQGYTRHWFRCNECGSITPYERRNNSLCQPLLVLVCGHGAGQELKDATTELTIEEATNV